MESNEEKIEAKEMAEEPIKKTEKEAKEPEKSSMKEKLDILNKIIAPATFAITIVTTLITGFIYAFRYGELFYWGISPFYISTLEGNSLFGILIYAALAIVFAAANVAIYEVLISRKLKLWKKLFECVGMVFLCDVILCTFIFLNAFWELSVDADVTGIIRKPGFLDLLGDLLWTCLPAAIIVLLLGTMFGILTLYIRRREKRAKRREEKSDGAKTDSSEIEEEKRTENLDKWNNILKNIFGVAFICAVFVLVVYGEGFYTAHTNNNFRIINDTQVILYEGEDYFVVSDCELVTDNDGKSTLYIDKKNKTEIEKRGTTTTEIKVDKTYRNKRQ